jgi:uncharacterized protein with GYD domain
MPFYLTRAKLSQEAIKALLANPQDRTAAVAKLDEALGGKLHHYFFAFGEYDVVLLGELPDNTSAAAALLTTAGSGAIVAQETTVLLTMDEAVSAMRKAGTVSGSYVPPGG